MADPGTYRSTIVPASRIIDRTGNHPQNRWPALYALFGTAPLWLPTLELVVASRAGVGVAEAGILTCCFALMSDMWSGTARARILGYQTMVASLSAVAIVGIGGALGASGWRAPFWVYAVSLLFARRDLDDDDRPGQRGRRPGQRGHVGPVRPRFRGRVVWALGPLSLAERGRATGVWFSCVTTAQFACPLAVLAIGAVTGGLSGALIVLGVLALVLAVTAGRIRTA